jgi:hypothetical protein
VQHGDDRQEVDAAVQDAVVLVGTRAQDAAVVAAGDREHPQPHRHRHHGDEHVGDAAAGHLGEREPEAQQVGDEHRHRHRHQVDRDVGGRARQGTRTVRAGAVGASGAVATVGSPEGGGCIGVRRQMR